MYLIIILLCICITTYIGLYPDEGFYADEFKKVTSLELPESADFISKSADYPDFHGNYCSSAALKLSKKDFKLLLQEMNNNLKMKKNAEIVSFAAFDKILKESNNKKITYSFIRSTSALNDNYLFIGFCDDAETIFVNVCCL